MSAGRSSGALPISSVLPVSSRQIEVSSSSDALAPCPPGWDFDPAIGVEIGRLAVKTGVWPLKQYLDGKVTHTHVPHPRLPVEEYLKLQGRFRHLFEPVRDAATLGRIQSDVDAYWAQVAA